MPRSPTETAPPTPRSATPSMVTPVSVRVVAFGNLPGLSDDDDVPSPSSDDVDAYMYNMDDLEDQHFFYAAHDPAQVAKPPLYMYSSTDSTDSTDIMYSMYSMKSMHQTVNTDGGHLPRKNWNAIRGTDRFVLPHRKWRAERGAEAALAYAVPHAVVSQVLRPETATFLHRWKVAMRTERDAQCCLTELSVSGSIAGLAEFASHYPALVTLSVRDVDDDCAEIAELTQLRKLTFNKTGPKATLPASMSQSIALKELAFHYCRFAAGDLTRLAASIVQLEALELTSCDTVDSQSIAQLGNLAELRYLSISACKGVGASVLSEVSKLSMLEKLHLSISRGVDAEGVLSLAKLPGLEELDLSACRNVNAECLSQIAKMPRLRVLDLECCNVTTKGLVHLMKLRSLRTLSVRRCGEVDHESAEVISKFPGLEKLDLCWCPGVSAASLAHVATMKTLRVLDLSNCAAVDDAALQHLSNLPQLRELSLCYCAVTREGVQHLARLPRLMILDLRWCDDVTLADTACFPRSIRVHAERASPNAAAQEAT